MRLIGRGDFSLSRLSRSWSNGDSEKLNETVAPTKEERGKQPRKWTKDRIRERERERGERKDATDLFLPDISPLSPPLAPRIRNFSLTSKSFTILSRDGAKLNIHRYIQRDLEILIERMDQSRNINLNIIHGLDKRVGKVRIKSKEKQYYEKK